MDADALAVPAEAMEEVGGHNGEDRARGLCRREKWVKGNVFYVLLPVVQISTTDSS